MFHNMWKFLSFIFFFNVFDVSRAASCTCGLKNPNRIVGGAETGVNEYPMMAGLVDPSIATIICGATIISSRHVLTAASCLQNYRIYQLIVLVGDHDTTTGSDTSSAAVHPIINFIVHPNYSSSNVDYNIAVVRILDFIIFSNRVIPVCLPFKFTNQNFDGDNVTILGWGSNHPGGDISNVLQSASVVVTNSTSCKQIIPSITDRQICTDSSGKDSCQGDQGGPVLYQDPSTRRYFIIGIITPNYSCGSGDKPTINTRVTSFLRWIQSVTPPVNYCVA